MIFIVCFANIISVVIICLVWLSKHIVNASWYDLYVCMHVRVLVSYIYYVYISLSLSLCWFFYLKNSFCNTWRKSRRFSSNLWYTMTHVSSAILLSLKYSYLQTVWYTYTYVLCHFSFDVLWKQESHKSENAPFDMDDARTRVHAHAEKRKISYLNRR